MQGNDIDEMDWRILSALDPAQLDLQNGNWSAEQLAQMIAKSDLQKEFFTDRVDPNLLKTFTIAQRLLSYFIQQQSFLNTKNNQTETQPVETTAIQQIEISRKLQMLQNENYKLRKLLTLQQNSCSLLHQLRAKTVTDKQTNELEELGTQSFTKEIKSFQCPNCSKCFRKKNTLEIHERNRHSKTPLDAEELVGPLVQQIQKYGSTLFSESKPLQQLTEQFYKQLHNIRDELENTRHRLEDERYARQRLQSLIEQEISEKLSSLQKTWLRMESGTSIQMANDGKESDFKTIANEHENQKEEKENKTIVDLEEEKSKKNIQIDEEKSQLKNFSTEQFEHLNTILELNNGIKTIDEEPKKILEKNQALITQYEISKNEFNQISNQDDRNNLDSNNPNVLSPTSQSSINIETHEDNKKMEEIVMKQGEIVQKLAQDVQLLVSTLNHNLKENNTLQPTSKISETTNSTINVLKPKNKPKSSFLDRLIQRELESQQRKEEKRRRAEEELQRQKEAKEAKKREKEARKMLQKLKTMPMNSSSLEQLALETERSNAVRLGQQLSLNERASAIELRSLSLHQFSSKSQINTIEHHNNDEQLLKKIKNENPIDEHIFNPKSKIFENAVLQQEQPYGQSNSGNSSHQLLSWSKMFKSWSPKFKKSKSMPILNDENKYPIETESNEDSKQVLNESFLNQSKMDTSQNPTELTEVSSNSIEQPEHVQIYPVENSPQTSNKAVIGSKFKLTGNRTLPSPSTLISPIEYQPPTLSHSTSSIILDHNLIKQPTKLVSARQRTPSPIDLESEINRPDPLDQYLLIQKNKIKKPPRRSKIDSVIIEQAETHEKESFDEPDNTSTKQSIKFQENLIIDRQESLSKLDSKIENTSIESTSESLDLSVSSKPVVLKGVLKKKPLAFSLDHDNTELPFGRKTKRITFNEQPIQIDNQESFSQSANEINKDLDNSSYEQTKMNKFKTELAAQNVSISGLEELLDELDSFDEKIKNSGQKEDININRENQKV